MVISRARVTLSAAISIDGRIATRTGDSRLSSRRDKARVHALRRRVDAILVGRGTVAADDPMLTARPARGKNPIRVILDPLARISTDCAIARTSKRIPTLLVATSSAPAGNIRRLEKKGLGIIQLGRKSIPVRRLLEVLYNQGIRRVLLEGGGATNWEFLARNLIDDAIITISPRMLGGRGAVSLIGGAGFRSIRESPGMRLCRTLRTGNEITLYYSASPKP